MSSLTFSNASPFATALPAPHVFTAYDADGDAIMTDAVTGLPITYGVSGSKRSRSASLDSDSSDSRPSKRSRTSSEEDEDDRAPAADACPPAPKKANPPPRPDNDEEDGEGNSALRNLAESMAEAVLAGEPRDLADVGPAQPAPLADVGPAVVPPGDGPAEEGWCLSLTCSDLALRLDMRHPRVVLNFLRFVKTYNELAPEGEEIHLPSLSNSGADSILGHESMVNPAPEFAAEVQELKDLIHYYRCNCYDCEPDEDSEDDWDRHSRDSYSSDRSRY